MLSSRSRQGCKVSYEENYVVIGLPELGLHEVRFPDNDCILGDRVVLARVKWGPRVVLAITNTAPESVHYSA